MPPRSPQSDEDLQQHLKEHLGFLERSCDAFDAGHVDEAKRLSVSIRVLVHDTNNSTSLLDQLGMLAGCFLSTATPFNERNLGTHHGLVAIAMGSSASYVAMLDNIPLKRQVPFSQWWEEIVFSDALGNRMSRKQLILRVANQDGGAHVDPTLNETYADLSKHNSLGWVEIDGTGETPLPPPHLAAVRQVAHEVLATLVPGYKKRR